MYVYMYLYCIDVPVPTSAYYIMQIHCKYRLLSQYIATSLHTVQYSVNTGDTMWFCTVLHMAVFLCYLQP